MKSKDSNFTDAEFEIFRRILRSKFSAPTILALVLVQILVCGVVVSEHDKITFFGSKIRTYLSCAPIEQEPVGLFANDSSNNSSDWSLCIYNGASPHFLGIMSFVGGNRFKEVASSSNFSHRANAHNPTQAANLLRSFRKLAKEANKPVRFIAISDHANIARPIIGETIDVPLLREIRELRIGCGTEELILLGCAIASGEVGQLHINLLADYCGLKVWAATKAVTLPIYSEGNNLLESMLRTGEFDSASPLSPML